MANEEEMSQLAVQAQMAQQQGQTIQTQLDVLQNTITDLNTTLDTLRNLKKAKTASLLPIGSGTYITAQKVEGDEVLIAVGAGVIVRKKTEEAAEMLEKRLKTVTEAFEKAQRDFEGVNRRLQELNAKAMALNTQVENVRPA